MIKGFWHIYMINNWRSIILEQLKVLKDSGLYEECMWISIGCLGNFDHREALLNIIKPYPRIGIKYHSEDSGEYEFATLRLIEADNDIYTGFYFHTKGVTRPHDMMQPKERKFLNEIMLNQWRMHKFIINTGYDISSVNYLSVPNRFSGNYFWFNRHRLNRLPKLETLDQTDRYNAEKWVYMSK